MCNATCGRNKPQRCSQACCGIQSGGKSPNQFVSLRRCEEINTTRLKTMTKKRFPCVSACVCFFPSHVATIRVSTPSVLSCVTDDFGCVSDWTVVPYSTNRSVRAHIAWCRSFPPMCADWCFLRSFSVSLALSGIVFVAPLSLCVLVSIKIACFCCGSTFCPPLGQSNSLTHVSVSRAP